MKLLKRWFESDNMPNFWEEVYLFIWLKLSKLIPAFKRKIPLYRKKTTEKWRKYSTEKLVDGLSDKIQ